MVGAMHRIVAVLAEDRPVLLAEQAGWVLAEGVDSKKRRCLFARWMRRSQAPQRVASSAQQKTKATPSPHTSHSIFIALLLISLVTGRSKSGRRSAWLVASSLESKNKFKEFRWQSSLECYQLTFRNYCSFLYFLLERERSHHLS